MDADSIDQLEAGRELDALVAVYVMGWEQRYMTTIYGVTTPMANAPEYLYPPQSDIDPSKVPAYSTDIAAAWEVLKKAAADSTTSLNVYRVDYEGEPWHCIFIWVDGGWYENVGGSALTVPLAICRAALKLPAYIN